MWYADGFKIARSFNFRLTNTISLILPIVLGVATSINGQNVRRLRACAITAKFIKQLSINEFDKNPHSVYQTLPWFEWSFFSETNTPKWAQEVNLFPYLPKMTRIFAFNDGQTRIKWRRLLKIQKCCFSN